MRTFRLVLISSKVFEVSAQGSEAWGIGLTETNAGLSAKSDNFGRKINNQKKENSS